MDPATIGAVLAAVAGGAGGALGAQVWDAVGALVRRPFGRSRAGRDNTGGNDIAAVSSGEAELAALAQAPADQRRAMALAEALVGRAEADRSFAADLSAWWEQARRFLVIGNVSNTVSGGTQYGPVLQGRDFTSLAFGVPAAAPPAETPADEGRPQ